MSLNSKVYKYIKKYIIMNIFILHEDPRKAAEMHCDKHVVKMIVETAQMLSTAHHHYNSPYTDIVYRACFKYHPCTKWVLESSANYDWAYDLFGWLLIEYNNRYGKIHKSNRLLSVLKHNPCPIGNRTPFVLAMPDEYKCDDVIFSYRMYYINEKLKFAKWQYTEKPRWLKNVSM